MVAQAKPQDTRRYRSVSTVRPIDAAKEKVPIVDLADLLCGPGQMRRRGAEWVARCPLPDHEDKTPSFTVNPEKGVFFCHGCLLGGDVVKLAQLAWGYAESEMAMAAANLLHEFGHEIPERPPAWYRKQERQRPVKDAIEQAKIHSAQRRLMRILEPFVARIEDDDERREEALKVWDDLGDAARMMVRRYS